MDIDCNRPLALVEAGPEQAVAIGGDWPAVVVESATDRIEADYIGSELGKRHSTQRACDERRPLDYAHATENACQFEISLLRVMPSSQ
jgi:hypothetical protein